MSDPAKSTSKRSTRELEDRRAPKRRAARACVHCRYRKVRCDVLNGGSPCTNCKIDGLDCPLAQSIRSKRLGLTRTQARSLHPDTLAAAHAERRSSAVSAEPTEQFPVSVTFEGPARLSGANDHEDLGASPSLGSPDNVSSHPSTASTLPQGLPQYFKPFPSHISGDDVHYLAAKDALTIPPRRPPRRAPQALHQDRSSTNASTRIE
ncbi:hypothetical protein BJX64DRAFT_295460 [Aspergillus heterothallicus]